MHTPDPTPSRQTTQYHFVVFYDTETDSFAIDDHSYIYFPNGEIFEDGSEWRHGAIPEHVTAALKDRLL